MRSLDQKLAEWKKREAAFFKRRDKTRDRLNAEWKKIQDQEMEIQREGTKLREEKAREALRAMVGGMLWVPPQMTNDPVVSGKEFKLLKVNRTRVEIEIDGKEYTIPMSWAAEIGSETAVDGTWGFLQLP